MANEVVTGRKMGIAVAVTYRGELVFAGAGALASHVACRPVKLARFRREWLIRHSGSVSPALVLHRQDRTDRRMAATRVREVFDEIEYSKTRVARRLEAMLNEQLAFK